MITIFTLLGLIIITFFLILAKIIGEIQKTNNLLFKMINNIIKDDDEINKYLLKKLGGKKNGVNN